MFILMARFLEPGTIYYTGDWFTWPLHSFVTRDDAQARADRIVASRLQGTLAERIEMQVRFLTDAEAVKHDKTFSW